jgi:hypothetical protein
MKSIDEIVLNANRAVSISKKVGAEIYSAPTLLNRSVAHQKGQTP